jgi:adenylate kinase family enzyme
LLFISAAIGFSSPWVGHWRLLIAEHELGDPATVLSEALEGAILGRPDSIAEVERVVILGRGGAGKSALAHRIGSLTQLPVIELDQLFWQPGLVATPRDRWVDIQSELINRGRWIIDGDLGPHDVLEPRLELADTVIVLDFSLLLCARRSSRRAREGAGFWRWVIGYRRRSLPVLMEKIAAHAPRARLHVLRTPQAVEGFLRATARGRSDLRS